MTVLSVSVRQRASSTPRNTRPWVLFGALGLLYVGIGLIQSWNLAFVILNMSIVSAVMSLGMSIQYGYAGLLNFGATGFVAVGGLTVVLVSIPPNNTVLGEAGGPVAVAFGIAGVTGAVAVLLLRASWLDRRLRTVALATLLGLGFFAFRYVFDPAVELIETTDPDITGNIGGLGWPVSLALPTAFLVSGLLALLIGKTAIRLRSDYLAIATLGLAEVMVAVIKNEDWLSRGVSNVFRMPRQVPTADIWAEQDWVRYMITTFGLDPVATANLLPKVGYAAINGGILLCLAVLAQRALRSPWGRMMRAIRDDEEAAAAMGKDVAGRRLQVFVLGSAIIGLAGAMLVLLDGQFTPISYTPLRFTFLVLVMAIIGGAGNNAGAILGGALIWTMWVLVEPVGTRGLVWLADVLALDGGPRTWLVSRAGHLRYLVMGVVLLICLRYFPRGLVPER